MQNPKDGLSSFQFYYSRTGVKVMCLCPSVAQTPILSGCTEAEIAKMKEDVGGLMSPEFVAEALVKLLEDERRLKNIRFEWRYYSSQGIYTPMLTLIIWGRGGGGS